MDDKTTQQNKEDVKETKPKIIALQNQKGGVGKTTVSQNLAIGLAQEGNRTMLIDLDAQTNATYGFGVELEELGRSELSTAQVMDPYKATRLKDVLIQMEQENLWLAPADLALSKTAAMLHGANFKETILQDAIREVEDLFDFILIDCPPSLDILPMNAFVAADLVLIPIQPEGYGFKGLRDLISTIDFVNKSSRPNQTDLEYRILFNKVSASFSLTEMLAESDDHETTEEGSETVRADKRRYKAMVEILGPISDKILKTVIRNSELFRTSQSIEMVQERDGETTERLVPVMMRPSKGTGRRDYQLLTKEVLGL